MTSSTNYKAARTATLNAAKDLYGSAGRVCGGGECLDGGGVN